MGPSMMLDDTALCCWSIKAAVEPKDVAFSAALNCPPVCCCPIKFTGEAKDMASSVAGGDVDVASRRRGSRLSCRWRSAGRDSTLEMLAQA